MTGRRNRLPALQPSGGHFAPMISPRILHPMKFQSPNNGPISQAGGRRGRARQGVHLGFLRSYGTTRATLLNAPAPLPDPMANHTFVPDTALIITGLAGARSV